MSQPDIRIVRIPTRGHFKTLKGHNDSIRSLVITPIDKNFLSGSKDGDIIIWDFILGKQIKRLKVPSGTVNCLKFFHDEYKLVTAGSSHNIHVWDLNSETIIRTLSLDDSVQVNSLDISPDNILMAFSGNFRHVRIWEFKETVWKRF